MIEKFFGMERVFASFLITILITAIMEFIFSYININSQDEVILIFAGIMFVLIKLMYANYDCSKSNKK